MIDFSVLPVFFLSIFFLVISPGPDLLLISTYSSSRGFKSGFAISVGIFIAGMIQTILVALGLGQLMQALPTLAWGIRIVGAVYLAWLGFNMLKSWLRSNTMPTDKIQTKTLGVTQLIKQGLLNNLMNPKALLFFSMFLPQFTNPESSLTSQILVLGSLLSITALIINTVFSLSFSKLGSYLGRKFNLGRHIDGILGVIFLGLATRLAINK
ncbi:TPA: LysE family translocator [Vibrio cholerae]